MSGLVNSVCEWEKCGENVAMLSIEICEDFQNELHCLQSALEAPLLDGDGELGITAYAARLAVHSDVYAGDHDNAKLACIPDGQGWDIGLKLVEDHTSCGWGKRSV
jgi:hypothetical protein